jgi:hypothetical protein
VTPKLSLCAVIANSGDRLEDWLTLALEVADEVVLMVDEASTDGTLATARRFADKVFVFEHPYNQDDAVDWCFRQATGDWILRLDDDEYMSRTFTDACDELLADRHYTHYLIPRRWVVRGEGDRYEWLTEFPWRPEATLRLVRNVGGLFWHPGGTHQPIRVAGEGRVLAPDEGVMYHMDLAWQSRPTREAKVYTRYAPMALNSGERMYLYEHEPSARHRLPVPDGELGRDPSVTARRRASVRAERPGPGLYNREPPHLTMARLQLSIAGWQPDAPVFGAEYIDWTVPDELVADCGYAAGMTLRNTSPARWAGPGGGPRIMLGTHWLSDGGEMVVWDGARTQLPRPVAAGETISMDAAVWVPPKPGRYRLELDLVLEEVAWFSHRGVPPVSIDVEVKAWP